MACKFIEVPCFKIHWTVQLQWVRLYIKKKYTSTNLFLKNVFKLLETKKKVCFVLTGQTGFSPRPVTYPAQMSTVSPGCYACYCATFSTLRLHSEQANVVKICFGSNVPVFCYPFKSTTDAVFKGTLTTWGGGNMEIVLSSPLSWVAHQFGKPDSTHQLPYWHKEVKVIVYTLKFTKLKLFLPF